MITQAQIDAAARALYEHWTTHTKWQGGDRWDDMYPDKRAPWVGAAKAALEAAERAAWRPIFEAPKDGTNILALTKHDKIPAVIYWQEYNADDQKEIGEPGYWAYAENLIGDVVGDADAELFMLIPALPEVEG